MESIGGHMSLIDKIRDERLNQIEGITSLAKIRNQIVGNIRSPEIEFNIFYAVEALEIAGKLEDEIQLRKYFIKQLDNMLKGETE